MSTEPRKTHFPRDDRDSVLDKRENIQGVAGTKHPHLPPQDDTCESALSGPECIQGEHKTEQKL